MIEIKIQEQLLKYAEADVEDMKEYAKDGEFSIPGDLMYEVVMNEPKNFIIPYCVKRKREKDRKEKEIQADIDNLQKQLNITWESEIQMAMDKKILELKELREKDKRGIITPLPRRSKLRWYALGEKPSKYFFGLEKRNYENKLLS